MFKNISKKFYSTKFLSNEIAIAQIRHSKYDKNTAGISRMFKLSEEKIFKTKYFDIFHKHIINRSANQCLIKLQPPDSTEYITISFKRPNLYEYISNNPSVAVPSQFSILSFVPFLLELDKDKKILESGTGNCNMTLFMSQYLDAEKGGLIHTFDIRVPDIAEGFYNQWKDNYNLRSSDNTNNKWFDNVKFFCSNIETHEFSEDFNDFYDIVYLDLASVHFAIKNVYKVLRTNGVIVINTMHLTQVIKCLKIIEDEKFSLVTEVIIEPSTRLWEIERYVRCKCIILKLKEKKI